MDLTLARTCGAATTAGAPCKRACAPGFTRCNLHGGHSPNARRAAHERLAAAALPAAEVLFEIIERWRDTMCEHCGHPKGDPGPVIRAAQVVLDRTGFHPTVAVTVEPKAVITSSMENLSDEELDQLIERLSSQVESNVIEAERIPTPIEGRKDDE